MSDLYYDPWAVDIDLDPYPTYRRLRDEQLLYYNERHDFWGLSRYTDVDTALRGSAHGSALPRATSSKSSRPTGDAAGRFHQRGSTAAHDPPRDRWANVHPKKMRALEDKVRAFCARA